MPKLENWTLMVHTDLSGECQQQLTGNVYVHSKADRKENNLCNKNSIVTFKLANLDLRSGIAVAQSGNVYDLRVKSNANIL